jgi:hypothetical protein
MSLHRLNEAGLNVFTCAGTPAMYDTLFFDDRTISSGDH